MYTYIATYIHIMYTLFTMYANLSTYQPTNCNHGRFTGSPNTCLQVTSLFLSRQEGRTAEVEIHPIPTGQAPVLMYVIIMSS